MKVKTVSAEECGKYLTGLLFLLHVLLLFCELNLHYVI